MQSRGQSIESWRDVTTRNFLAHPERGGPLLKRPGIGWEGVDGGLPRRLRLYEGYMEDIVSEQTDGSGCPGGRGPWLEKPDLAGLGG